jgi:hypothetical protein
VCRIYTESSWGQNSWKYQLGSTTTVGEVGLPAAATAQNVLQIHSTKKNQFFRINNTLFITLLQK